jgi:hypothetical protein
MVCDFIREIWKVQPEFPRLRQFFCSAKIHQSVTVMSQTNRSVTVNFAEQKVDVNEKTQAVYF